MCLIFTCTSYGTKHPPSWAKYSIFVNLYTSSLSSDSKLKSYISVIVMSNSKESQTLLILAV